MKISKEFEIIQNNLRSVIEISYRQTKNNRIFIRCYTIWDDDLNLENTFNSNIDVIDGFLWDIITATEGYDGYITINDYFDTGAKYMVRCTGIDNNLKHIATVYTGFAQFKIFKDFEGDLWESHCGYSRGCFYTEPELTYYRNRHELIGDLFNTYGNYRG